ncbi:hypothetical protein [Paraburkholderia sp. 22B1P]|uniref:hypothetical protein n=1 Tax=Paraburkholderia sp. 22B1P TaxID=3080498 RepID=UPI0030868547|nr:alpha-IPM isomerase [Paraburkholderia sp. 22B1P]
MKDGWRTRGRCHVFGSDIAHDNGMMAWQYIIERQVDPTVLIPQLFAAIDPEFASNVREGDFIVAGRNFGTGKAHTNAYIAMEALGLRVLCESTFVRVRRATANLGLPLMGECEGITSWLRTGDEIEVDVSTGTVLHIESGMCKTYPPIREDLRRILAEGGRQGLLQRWLVEHPELSTTEN